MRFVAHYSATVANQFGAELCQGSVCGDNLWECLSLLAEEVKGHTAPDLTYRRDDKVVMSCFVEVVKLGEDTKKRVKVLNALSRKASRPVPHFDQLPVDQEGREKPAEGDIEIADW